MGTGIIGFNTPGASVPAVYGREELWVPVDQMFPFAAGWVAAANITTATAGGFLSPMRYLAFDGATSAETAYFNMAMPKRWNRGTITFRAYWRASTTGTGTVLWGISGRSMSDGDASGAYSIVYVTDTANGTQYDLHITDESGPVTVQGTPAVEDLISFLVIRDVADTNTVDAWLEGVKIYWTSEAATDD